MSKPGQQPLPITVIVCRRGRAPSSAPCSVVGCSRPHMRLCDFPLAGAKLGQTCDAKLCEEHASRQVDTRDYCPPHARLAARGNPGDRQR